MEGLALKGKTILVTGHTGFKGAWLCVWLHHLGAKVIGASLDPYYEHSVYEATGLRNKITDLRCDVRDYEKLRSIFAHYKPDVVFHLAAQALVRTSLVNPKETFETNALGTLNVLECIKEFPPQASVIITSDKCYKNVEQSVGYKEEDEMGGKDPYSSSKACAELISQVYMRVYLDNIVTTRAGNVIGGGDWSENRLIPDIIRSLREDQDVIIRSPDAIRPWQHVLEPLSGYIFLAESILRGENVKGSWNFGPKTESMIPVSGVVEHMFDAWGGGRLRIERDKDSHESTLLFLDCSKAHQQGWKPRLTIKEAIKMTVDWYRQYESTDAYALCVRQIEEFCARNSIDGVLVKPLKKLENEAGNVMHMLRRDDEHFSEFGEVYFSTINPGHIKGWHKHTQMTRNYAVVSGEVKLVLYDDRFQSPTQGKVKEILLGENNYSLVRIPPGVISSFSALGARPAIIANCSTQPHTQGESQKLDIDDPSIPYTWKL